jgi:hypothetical protein
MLVLYVLFHPKEEEEEEAKRGFTFTIHFLQEIFVCA